ncbi:MAG: hypothetical protein SX243_22140 [Acidobacteriota bacterium]|nr:hypothetical protein [Acidobacteriota bacterium]
MLRIGLLCVVAVLAAGSAAAQLAGPISVNPLSPVLMPGEIGEVVVSGVGSCPTAHSGETTSDTVIIVFNAHCPILPPEPTPFAIRVPVGPLETGTYTVEVREAGTDELLATAPWQVGYPYGTFDLEISPTPVAPGEVAQAIVTGRAPCPLIADLVVEDDEIDLLINNCGLPLPPAEDFRLTIDLPPLSAGDYTVGARNFLDGVYFALEDLAVLETPTQLELLPAIASNLEDVVARLDGFSTCPSLRFVDVSMPRIEISYSTGCPFTPPPPPSEFTFPITLGQLDPGDYTVVASNTSTGEEVTRDLLVVERAPPLRFDPAAPRIDDPVTAIVGLAGVEVCDPAPVATIEFDQVEIRLDDDCLQLPPGPAGTPPPVTEIPVELGLLEADTYTVRVLGTNDALLARGRLDVRAFGACIPSLTSLCLQGGRFQVRAEYTSDLGSGSGRAVQETDDSGSFTFFNENNVELVVKVLDGCGTSFRSYWVFAAGLTNVGVRLTVTDTERTIVRQYDSPQGTTFETILDTMGFFTCR